KAIDIASHKNTTNHRNRRSRTLFKSSLSWNWKRCTLHQWKLDGEKFWQS
ncbi:unnamed protein product, partial [Allacma fusca]